MHGDPSTALKQRVHITLEVSRQGGEVARWTHDLEARFAHGHRRPMVSRVAHDHTGSKRHIVRAIGPLLTPRVDGMSTAAHHDIDGMPRRRERSEQVMVAVRHDRLASGAGQTQHLGLLRAARLKQRRIHHACAPVGEGEHRVQVHGAALLGHLDHQHLLQPLGQQLGGQPNDHRPAGALRGADAGDVFRDHEHIATLDRKRRRAARLVDARRALGNPSLGEARVPLEDRPGEHGLAASRHFIGIADHDGVADHGGEVTGEDEVGRGRKHMLTVDPSADGPRDQRCGQRWAIQGVQLPRLVIRQPLEDRDVRDQTAATRRVLNGVRQEPLKRHHLRHRGEHIAELIVLI